MLTKLVGFSSVFAGCFERAVKRGHFRDNSSWGQDTKNLDFPRKTEMSGHPPLQSLLDLDLCLGVAICLSSGLTFLYNFLIPQSHTKLHEYSCNKVIEKIL